MHIIALLRTALTEEEQAERLQRLLGISPYEARQHAQIEPPRALASRPSIEEATALAGKLSVEGLQAIAFAPEDAFSKRFVAKSVASSDDGVVAVDKHGAQASLPWADVTAIFLGAKNKVAYCDLVDGSGSVLRAREGESVFVGTGSRAGTIALAHTARAKSNGRFDDRLLKPAAVATVLGSFASSPNADDLAEWLLWRSYLL